jgi:hypothetical protein
MGKSHKVDDGVVSPRIVGGCNSDRKVNHDKTSCWETFVNVLASKVIVGNVRVTLSQPQHTHTQPSTRRLLIDGPCHPTINRSLLQTMSHTTSSSASPSNFDAIFNSALDAYKKRTKKDLTSHPLLPTLQACNNPDAVLAVLREQIPAFTQSQNADDKLTKWLVPTVNVLYGFSGALGEGVSLVSIKTSPCCETFASNTLF